MNPQNRPTMPTGWAWLCPCGWSTGRHDDLAQIEHRRYGHRVWHDHMQQLADRQPA